MKTNNNTDKKYYKASFSQKLKEQKYLIAMSAPFVIWVLVFKYAPLVGWLMAFQDYKPAKGILGSKWVGLKHFITLFKEEQFYQALTNTLGMSILAIIFGTMCSITFAILLNEMRGVKYKRIVQTVSYLPHFVSWVVVANIVGQLLSPNGIVNELLVNAHLLKTPINFLAVPNMFWGVVTTSDIWKETGWNAIIYLAAITGIDMQLYEAAKVDGANRWQQIWNITLPSIRGTIIILLIMNIGGLVNIGFEKQYLLGNNIVAEKSLVLDKYILDYGIGMMRYSYGTAIGIFKSVVSIVLIWFANNLAKKTGEGQLI
ncbi:ABC transporter permease [Cellulosilyticum ruminicola]|uniref:ABC transporter permease n=1 Tax=Cellulosilyticum ruminicola TaxID=425254 RepID=UPI000B2D395E|nr:ABC transporter permease subunit [Cellulosilyticum ruminicola]